MELNNYSCQEKMLKKMRDIVCNNPDSVRIVETNVDAGLQIEFYENLQIAGKSKSMESIDSLHEKVYDENTSIEEKKDAFIQLVLWEDVKAYRIIEDYLKDPNTELQDWAYLSSQQARMFIESDLLEDPKIFIASGLGGKEHRLRFIIVFSTSDGVFSQSQKEITSGEVEYLFKKNDGIVENIGFVENYVLITALIPLYLDIVELIHGLVDEINQYGNFLKANVFITNEKIISDEELDLIFKNADFKSRK